MSSGVRPAFHNVLNLTKLPLMVLGGVKKPRAKNSNNNTPILPRSPAPKLTNTIPVRVWHPSPPGPTILAVPGPLVPGSPPSSSQTRRPRCFTEYPRGPPRLMRWTPKWTTSHPVSCPPGRAREPPPVSAIRRLPPSTGRVAETDSTAAHDENGIKATDEDGETSPVHTRAPPGLDDSRISEPDKRKASRYSLSTAAAWHS